MSSGPLGDDGDGAALGDGGSSGSLGSGGGRTALVDVLKRVGVFALVVLVVVAGGTAVGGAPVSSAPTVSDVTVESFSGSESVVDVPPQEGELSMSADGDGKVVVIDTVHSGSIQRAALTPMVNTLTESGAEVRYRLGSRSGGGSLNESLAAADAYVVIGEGDPYTADELRGLDNFTRSGGRVLVVNEPSTGLGALSLLFGGVSRDTVTSPLSPAVSQAGLGFGSGYLYNVENYDLNYRSVYATPTGESPLTEGVDRAVVHASLPVTGDAVLTTTDGTTLSETRRSGAYGVVARSGNTTVVGDSSLFDQEFLYRADNEKLVGNLLDYLVSGEKRPDDAPGTGSESESPFGA
jgi:hypothetical protein